MKREALPTMADFTNGWLKPASEMHYPTVAGLPHDLPHRLNTGRSPQEAAYPVVGPEGPCPLRGTNRSLRS